MGQRPLVTWSAVGSASQSQLSLVDSAWRSIFAPNLPTPIRSLFSLVHARRHRPHTLSAVRWCGHEFVKSRGGGCPDSVHLACVQCFTVSCGWTEDTSC